MHIYNQDLSILSCSGNDHITDDDFQCRKCIADYFPIVGLPGKCVQCYITCKICTMSGNNITHKCTSCNLGSVLATGNSGNCIPTNIDIDVPDLPNYRPNYPIDNNTRIEFPNKSVDYYPSDESNSNINRPSVDLGECEHILRLFYKIPAHEPLIIAQITDTSTNTPTQPFEYIVLDITGREGNLSLCNNVDIITSSPIDLDMVNFNESVYKSYSNKTLTYMLLILHYIMINEHQHLIITRTLNLQ